MTTLKALISCLLAGSAAAQSASAWPQSAYSQAKDKLASMSLQDKLNLVHGYPGQYVGNVPAWSGLGLPALSLEDGPQGVADGVRSVTAWPSAATVAMSWDPENMYLFGVSMAQEQVTKGTNVMLGPGLNIARVPWAGRTFEYVGGEDPVLAAKLVPAEIAGIQSMNISANAKHFVCNSQEYNRDTVSENVPKRAFMELYTAGFAAAVDAGVGSIMCSYNRINNTYACENAETLGWLKGEAGFDGWVMSDWGATHSTTLAAMAGLDQQMPDDSFFGQALSAAVANGSVPLARVDDMAMRILVPMYALNLIADPPTGNIQANATSTAHAKIAEQLAAEATVLLKNDAKLLPLNKNSLKSILVLGDENTVLGRGSGGVVPSYIITPWQGIYEFLNGALPTRPNNCTFQQGVDYYQPGNTCVPAASAQDCCDQCTATAGCYAFTFVPNASCDMEDMKEGQSGTNSCWLKPDATGLTPHAGLTSGICAPYNLPNNTQYNVSYYSGLNATTAAKLAMRADVVIISVAVTSSEGIDRTDLSLPSWQDQLVSAVAAVHQKVVVNVRCPGACFMPWKDQVSTIIFTLLPGQEAGRALASVLFGDVNPSGKLPLSFPRQMNDTWLGNPVNPAQYPGTQRTNSWLEVDYSEGLLMGYRWFDSQNIVPLWPFGHGLSYSTWRYSGLDVTGSVSSTSNATISFDLRNMGPYVASEVAQMYIAYPAAANEPPKLLKDFAKVKNIAAYNDVTVSFTLQQSQLKIWDTIADAWQVVPGTYTILIGSSSQDLRLSGSVNVAA